MLGTLPEHRTDCGADYTLARFSSLVLVTVNVTRKMFTMLLSVVLFGHTVTGRQWGGVGLVFSGIGAEALIHWRSKTGSKKEVVEKKAK